MKVVNLILIGTLILLTFGGCSQIENTNKSVTETQQEEQPLFPDIEYTEIDDIAFLPAVYGKTVSECGLPIENLFIEDEKMQGYDYVSLCRVNGSVSIYLTDEKITSIVFGSSPYEDKELFREAFVKANKAVADAMRQTESEPTFVGSKDEGDNIDKVFDGSGVLSAEYVSSDMSVSVRSCGVNDAATIIIECTKAIGG